uniref:HD domain-containing protein n=1 Tax=Pseudomonas syringae TaxID=317 RepID=I6R481_PSESX|nr:hypothetical protein [Pseudomonas syringae]
MSCKRLSVCMHGNPVDVPLAMQTLRTAMDGCGQVRLSDGTNVLEHALWAAHQAVMASCDNTLIVAALFHDIGHYLCAGDPELAEYYKDREHAALGARWLSRWFGRAVCAPIELHIEAKRYLATIDTDYRRQLGAGSLQSLEHQGGLMSAEEVRAFRQVEHFESALLVRQFDDTPFKGETLPPYSWYERIVASVMGSL